MLLSETGVLGSHNPISDVLITLSYSIFSILNFNKEKYIRAPLDGKLQLSCENDVLTTFRKTQCATEFATIKGSLLNGTDDYFMTIGMRI